MNLYFVLCIIFVIADLIFLFFGSYHTWSLWFDGLAFWYFFTAFICGSISTRLGYIYYFNKI